MRDEKQLRDEINNLCAEFEKEIGKGLQPADFWAAKSAVLSAKAAVLADINFSRAIRRVDWLIVLTIILFFAFVASSVLG
jgi:hypothetical protein